jgi:hypothetical protein
MPVDSSMRASTVTSGRVAKLTTADLSAKASTPSALVVTVRRVPRAARLRSWLARPFGRLFAEDRLILATALVFAASELITLGWDLPGSHGWENDGVAPRDFFGGLAHNLTPGATHRYPLFHYLLLAFPSLPVLLVATLAGPLTSTAIQERVLAIPTMTAISLIAKLTATAMATVTLLALARLVRRTFGVREARCAALFAATNLTFAFYGRVSNLDVPYLMWTLLALDAVLDVLEGAGASATTRFGLCAAAAIATKDQAYASFVLVAPGYLVLAPLVRQRGWSRADTLGLARSAGLAAIAYGLLSGAILNPRGFLRRLDELRGPSSQAWRAYSKDLSGLTANVHDALTEASHIFWPLPIFALSLAGVVVALARKPGATLLEGRAPRALPFVAGASSFFFFTLAVARAEHRFLLPLGFFLSAYAGVAAAVVIAAAERAGSARLGQVVVAGGVLWAALASFAVHLTQLGDARREVTAFLARQRPGTRVETYGLLVYQPHFDVSRASPYRVTRVGPEPPRGRNPLVGAVELEAPLSDVATRRPDVLVFSEGFANSYLTRGGDPARPLSEIVAGRQKDAKTAEFVRAAVADRLPGYHQALVARPHLPTWARALGLEPVPIQATTGLALWVLVRDGR